jgi:hypothetical protein
MKGPWQTEKISKTKLKEVAVEWGKYYTLPDLEPDFKAFEMRLRGGQDQSKVIPLTTDGTLKTRILLNDTTTRQQLLRDICKFNGEGTGRVRWVALQSTSPWNTYTIEALRAVHRSRNGTAPRLQGLSSSLRPLELKKTVTKDVDVVGGVVGVDGGDGVGIVGGVGDSEDDSGTCIELGDTVQTVWGPVSVKDIYPDGKVLLMILVI